MAKNWLVVGISGVTCGGKTSLCDHLLNEFEGSVLVNQDKFFLDKHSDRHVIIPELNHQNWECLESIDWDSMMSKINQLLDLNPPAKKLLLVEGHIIYNYSPLEKLFDRKYFFVLTEEECFRRRRNRVYDPPDPPGYFEKCIWPMYGSNKKVVDQKSESVVYLDGSQKQDVIKRRVVEELKFLL